ncbi:hypothetical protein M218_05965 [Burkholderia pseudomallei MSHR338]|nr:hypothetical protein M218_05965 [Burkholderia pseudomallei MSHR338]
MRRIGYRPARRWLVRAQPANEPARGARCARGPGRGAPAAA